jgi:erythrin-vacuolar iron transport family protein
MADSVDRLSASIEVSRCSTRPLITKPSRYFVICHLPSVISFEPQARMRFFLSFLPEDKAPRRVSARELCRLAPAMLLFQATGVLLHLMVKPFHELDEKELLALAISSEEEDSKIYGSFAERVRAEFPATAQLLDSMQEQESDHRRRLIDAFESRFGNKIPLIRRQDVKGFVRRRPIWMNRTLSLQQIRREVQTMESETTRFYERALDRTSDPTTRKLLGDLVEVERKHEDFADEFVKEKAEKGEFEKEDEAQRRLFVLQVVQPGLAGLMDGSVSTLAPVFAAAFATRNSWDAFLVGLAASVGAGISMGFAEALSDDGVLSGRGQPLLRGGICGLMTTLGGIGHTLPFLIPNFYMATWVAVIVVAIELAVIAWIRNHYMDTPLVSAIFQVVLGGVLVFLAGIAIGSAG